MRSTSKNRLPRTISDHLNKNISKEISEKKIPYTFFGSKNKPEDLAKYGWPANISYKIVKYDRLEIDLSSMDQNTFKSRMWGGGGWEPKHLWFWYWFIK